MKLPKNSHRNAIDQTQRAVTSCVFIGALLFVGCDGGTSDDGGGDAGPIGAMVYFVDPPVVYNGIDTEITIYASDVTAPVTVELLPASGVALALTVSDDSNTDQIRALVPAGTAAGTYDLRLTGGDAETAVTDAALEVVELTELDLLAVQPAFGAGEIETAITLTADDAGGGFLAIPRLYLRPSGGGAAVIIQAVTFLDSSTVTAEVPSGLAVGSYDFIVVNPDGKVGVSDNPAEQFLILAAPPPRIDGISPGSVRNDPGCTLTLAGQNFASPVVELNCEAPDGTTSTLAVTEVSSDATSFEGTFDADSLSEAFCIVRLTNADTAFDEFSALVVTGYDQKLFPFAAGPDLSTARRSPAAAAARVNNAARYVYAIGGDDGTDGNTFDTVEAAAVDISGRLHDFHTLRYRLATPRAMHGSAAMGRFVYVIGGTEDGSAALTSIERAHVLSLDERPHIESVDLGVSETDGLGAGTWYYRVAALLPADDPLNPGGETLASEAFVVRVPDLGDALVQVTLEWTAVDDAVGYRIYRSPAAGAAAGEERLAWETTAVSTGIDDGKTASGDAALQVGALGKWHQPMTAAAAPLALAEARKGAAVTQVMKPDGSGFVIYILAGDDGTGVQNNYQTCVIDIAADGGQSMAQNCQVGSETFASPRWKAGAYIATPDNAPNVGAAYYLYLGGGVDPGDVAVNDFDWAEIQWPAGDLTAFASFGGSATMNNQAGYAPMVANNHIYAFGGKDNGPSDINHQTYICNNDGLGCNDVYPPETRNWTNTEATLTTPRYLMGSALESAFIYLVGGETPDGTATATTERTVW